MQLEEKIGALQSNPDYRQAWDKYRDTVLGLIETSGAKSVLEVGGGRFPYLTQEEIARLGIVYTSNDISERELSLAPEWVNKAHFDVQTADRATVAPFAGQFDFAFSKMVMEHVASYERAYRNLYDVLRPGGISLAFHPVLYTVPFVVNRVIPEKLAARILTIAFPHRTDDGVPKFPATYSGCRISARVREKLKGIGFSEVWQVPFYGHNYYHKLPVVRSVHNSVTEWAKAQKVTELASYAYTIAVK
jgi:SAM-dependent methyltransferase